MATLLNEAIEASENDVAKMPKFLPLSTAQNINTVSSLQQSIVPDYKYSKTQRMIQGANEAIAQMRDISPALQLFGEEAQLGLGGYFGADEEYVNRKKLNIATLQRNLATQQRNRMQDITPETADSWSFKIGQGITNLGMMAIGGATTAGARALGMGAAKAAALGTVASIASAIPLENIEQQSDRIKFDEQGNIDTSKITPEWARKAVGGETFYMAGMGILEAKFGMFKNLTLWQKPIPFKNNLLKNLSVPATTALKSFINEGTTEGLQSLLSSGIQLAEGNITLSDLPDRLQQAWQEAIIGGLFGGGVGTAVGINQAHNVKKGLTELVQPVIQDAELTQKVVDAIYESGTVEMTNVISKELELSSELNAKHGAIYDSMQGAIYDAINSSGAFQGVEEAELAQYVSETSKMFANQVLAEANKRGVLIDEVLKASDIKFENGKIYMQAGNQVIAETQIAQEEAKPEIISQKGETDADIEWQDYLKRRDIASKAILFYAAQAKFGKSYSKKEFNMLLGALRSKKVYKNKGFNKRVQAFYDMISQPDDKITVSTVDPSWAEFGYVSNGENDYELVQKALEDLINNRTRPISPEEEYANYVEETVGNIKSKFDNAKSLDELMSLYDNELENLSKDLQLDYILEDLTNNYLKNTERLKNEQTRSIKQNEGNPEEISRVDSGTAQAGDAGSNQGNITQTQGQNQEINPDTKLYQLINTPKQKKVYKGAFNYAEKSIKLFEAADFSTLPHELAHYWLDNMWSYYRSGKASEAYSNNFKGVLDWLGVKDHQTYFTDAQQEKFARGYEKYLLNGYAPTGLVQGAFDDYDKWLQKVYNDARELKVKLSADAIEFFDTMTTGELPAYDVPETQAEIRQKNIEQMNKDIAETKKVVVEKQEQFNNYDGGNVITSNTVPVTTEGEKRKSRAYSKQAAILGIAEQLNYNRADIEEQNRLAADFVKNNLEEARQIVNGEKEAPKNILKNAIYNAYLKEMLAIGDTDNYVNALRNQSLELTRAGQEIASQRGAIENIFDSAYWVRRIEALKKMKLADSKYGSATKVDSEQSISRMNDYIKNKVEEVIPEFMEADPASQKIIAARLSKEIANEFKVKPDSTILYQSMREPAELRTKTNAYNYLYRCINGTLGLELTREQVNEIIAKTSAIQKSIETTRNRNGNPSALFFKNISEMEAYANSIEPSPALAILTSTVGRGNMLFSPKTILLNIESNIVNFLTEATTRRMENRAINTVVDPKVIKEYLDYSREVFNVSGYQVSSMPDLDPTTQILSEKMTTSAGDRYVDKLGRFFEQTIFKYGLGLPDLYFKDMTFVDTANLLASKEAKGDVKKATELFKDICLIEPKTAAGKRIRELAINEALVATYQNKGKVSELALGIRNSINKYSGSLNLGDMLSPFVKTPANVIGLGFDYSMGGLVALKNIQTIYNDIQNGTFTETTRKSLRSLSRNGIGFAAAMLLASMIDDDDYIPDYALLDAKERELVKLKGGVFNSIKIGNRYVSLDYFGPLAMPLVSILNARRGNTAKEKAWDYFQGSAYQALKLPVIGDLKSLLEGTGRTLSRDVDSNLKAIQDASIDFVSSRAIPAIVTDIAKMTDDYERETSKSAVNRVKSKLPIMRETLPAKYNYGTGRPVETQSGISVLLSGARVKEEVSSSVIREINKLDKKNTSDKVKLSPVTKAGDLSKLSEPKKLKVEKEFAKRYASDVKNLIGTPKYSALDNEDKVKAINKIRDNIRDDIKVEYGLAKPKRRRK